ncbi:MAG TPA: M56 family metallopeptidase [Bryobacteraceae bacterium]|nr:M56 family metallopeptidase [Bryobacteraceae bacterium]
MSAGLLWDNVVAYSLQIGLLVGLAAVLPVALRLRMQRARLFYWRLLLAACLMLPLIRPLRHSVATARVYATTTVLTTLPPSGPTPLIHFSRPEWLLLLLAAGALVRLVWLGVGMWRLACYRRHSYPLEPLPAWGVEADLRVSDEICSPVTFGWRNPVVLLPPQFPDLDASKQDAILCHEIFHVRRHDWLCMVVEELLRAVFWFHPAIWWLLGEIQLTREQVVDREVIAMTQARDDYVDALLAMAGAHPRLDLAPAPLFLRKRHLKQRVVSILKEVRMSKTKWITALALSSGMLAAACWFVTGAFPLAAEPQMVADAPGVSVDLNGAQLIHRSPVSYPREVMQKGIQGTVVVQAKLNANGEVTDANILSGPDELRKPAIRSVLDWHFMNAAGGTRQVSIAFELPKEPVNTLAGGVVGGVQQGAPGGSAPSASPATAAPGPMTLRRIDTMGLSDEARSELLSRLPVRQGDNISDDQVSRVRDAVREFDGHLNVSLKLRSNREASIMISSPAANLITTPTVVAPPGSIRVGGNVQQANLVSKITPVYPPLAKQARIQGTVSLYALIGKDGHIEDLSVIQGHPLLVQATLDAVQDWVYKPTLLNGNPVEVLTQIDVNFTLSQ